MTLLLRLASSIAESIRVRAVGILVDPGADRDLEAELRGDRRTSFVAFRRRVQADRSRQGGEFLQVGANPSRSRRRCRLRCDPVKRARRMRLGKCPRKSGALLLLAEYAPHCSVNRGHKQQNTDGRRASRPKPPGANRVKKRDPSPRIRPSQRQLKHTFAT